MFQTAPRGKKQRGREAGARLRKTARRARAPFFQKEKKDLLRVRKNPEGQECPSDMFSLH
jgi:hypothetical protein